MTEAQKLVGLNKKVIEALAAVLHENQMNFTDAAFALSEIQRVLREHQVTIGHRELNAISALLHEAAKNNHAAVSALNNLVNNEQAKAHDNIVPYARERGYLK